MSKELDLDDVAETSPRAKQELAEMRERMRTQELAEMRERMRTQETAVLSEWRKENAMLRQQIQALEDKKENDKLRQMLSHLWRCPYEPYACDDPLHLAANREVERMAGL